MFFKHDDFDKGIENETAAFLYFPFQNYFQGRREGPIAFTLAAQILR